MSGCERVHPWCFSFACPLSVSFREREADARSCTAPTPATRGNIRTENKWGSDSLSIPLRFPSRRTGTCDSATTGIDARQACISRCPDRSTATWLAMALKIRWFTVSFLVQQSLRISVSRWRVFSRAFHHVCINDTRKCNKCQTFFCENRENIHN